MLMAWKCSPTKWKPLRCRIHPAYSDEFLLLRFTGENVSHGFSVFQVASLYIFPCLGRRRLRFLGCRGLYLGKQRLHLECLHCGLYLIFIRPMYWCVLNFRLKNRHFTEKCINAEFLLQGQDISNLKMRILHASIFLWLLFNFITCVFDILKQ